MKRSEVNELIRRATACFARNGWALPPQPRWDVTDFGLGDWRSYGLVLVNLADEPEYCEKLMYVQKGMTTPAHTHRKKKEDIICRWGELLVLVWPCGPPATGTVTLPLNGENRVVEAGETLRLQAGERITLVPGVYHEFLAGSDEAILGEVSTANDDVGDNFFSNPRVGRFSAIEEDEVPIVQLVSD
jgi:hypothetical protein